MLEVLGGAGAPAESPEGDGAGLSADDDVPLPSMTQLRLYATTHFIPFVGFGFLDNSIMILAGDYIDFKLGCTLGISTMAAAAIGNTVSDVAGIWGSGFIEHVAALIGLPGHGITHAQERKFPVRIVKNSAMIVGITLGCLAGMFPLVFPTEWRLWPTRESMMSPAPVEEPEGYPD